MKRIFVAMFAVFVVVFFSAAAPAAEWNWGSPVPNSEREWTILVYSDGDNNLEKDALLDLKEMEQGIADDGKTEVIVLLDRAKGFYDGEGDWTDTRAFRVKKSISDDAINSELIANCGELNMGDPNTLEQFIRAAIKKYPSKKIALVLWNHGGGWVAMANDEDAPGAQNGTDELTINELRDVLAKTAPLASGGKFEMLNFDMCLMAQSEVIAACKPFVKYMTAGATVIPSIGMDYFNALKLFQQGLDTAEIAIKMIEIGTKGFSAIGCESASLTAFDLSKADDFLSSFKKFSDKLSGIANEAWRDVTRTFFYAPSYGSIDDYQRGPGALSSIDLIEWLNRLKKMPSGQKLMAEINALEESARAMILKSEAGHAVPMCRGISTYAPLRGANMNDGYKETDFGKVTGWNNTLSKIHAAQAKLGMKKPEITGITFGHPVPKRGITKPRGGADFDMKPISGVMPLSTSNPGEQSWVKIVIEGENILWGYVGFAVSDKEKGDYIICMEQLLSDENLDVNAEKTEISTPVFKDGKNELVYQVAGMLHFFNNGETQTLICPKYSDISDRAHFMVAGKYSGSNTNGAVPVVIKVNFEFGQISEIIATTQDENGNFIRNAITPEPDGVFTPVLSVIKNDGGVQKIEGKPIKWKEGFSLVVEPYHENGYVRAMGIAESIGGASQVTIGNPAKVLVNPLISKKILDTTHKEGASHAIGRFAIMTMVPLKGADETIFATNGSIVEISTNGDDNIFAVTTPDGKTEEMFLLFQSEGLPIFRLVSKIGERFRVLLAYYVVLIKEGEGDNTRYLWRMISAQDGSITALVPLKKSWFPDGFILGDWTGKDGSKLSFSKDKITFSEGNKQGTYTSDGHLIKAKFSDGSELNLSVVSESDSLTVTFMETQNAMDYTKAGTQTTQTLPPPTPQQFNINGVWGAFANGNQMALQIQGNQYQFWMNGMVSEYGTIQVQGNVLFGQSNNGGMFQNYFQFDPTGMYLTIQYQNGIVLTYQRMQ